MSDSFVEYALIGAAVAVPVLGVCLVILFKYNVVLFDGSKWGVNGKQINCPECAALQPTLRKPANARQSLWGGWTCNGCGTEMDKWGKRIGS